jgi:hypothetical protein
MLAVITSKMVGEMICDSIHIKQTGTKPYTLNPSIGNAGGHNEQDGGRDDLRLDLHRAHPHERPPATGHRQRGRVPPRRHCPRCHARAATARADTLRYILGEEIVFFQKKIQIIFFQKNPNKLRDAMHRRQLHICIQYNVI